MNVTPPTVLVGSFKNTAGVKSRSKDVQSSDYFFSHFHTSDLSLLGIKAFRHWVPCERNSFYSLSLIILKLCTFFSSWSVDVHDVLLYSSD